MILALDRLPDRRRPSRRRLSVRHRRMPRLSGRQRLLAIATGQPAPRWQLEKRLMNGFKFAPSTVVQPTGTYLAQIRRSLAIEAKEEYALAKRWREHGDREAERRLITSHLRLVAKIAWSYRGYGLPFFKLVHEGNRALVEVVTRFDPDGRFRLAALARTRIEEALVDYVLASWPQVQAGSATEKMKLFFDLCRLKAGLTARSRRSSSHSSVALS